MTATIIKPLSWVLCIALFSFVACKKDDPEKIAIKDREKILEYIQANDLDAQELESGVFYVIDVEGIGGHPTSSSTVVINYKGYLLNGEVFDAMNYAQINLNGTIMGWREGIPMFKRGGKGILLIPSGLGYGSYPQNKIPANSVLIFDVELIEF